MIELPIPTTFLQWVWLGIGLTFGRAFGKELDQDVQGCDWFKALKPWQQWIVKRLLDFLHHWYIGALLMLYGWSLCFAHEEIYWFGYGLLLDDIVDVPSRLKKLLKYLWQEEFLKGRP